MVGSSILSTTSNESISYTAAAGTYYAMVHAYSSTVFNATTCYTLKVALGTATKPDSYISVNKQNLSVYPNPVQSTLNIDFTGFEGISEIRLYDINGNQVMNKKTSQMKTQLDVSKLSGGIYLIKALKGQTVVSRTKIVKQ